jgi:excisionase family DNA binding protein
MVEMDSGEGAGGVVEWLSTGDAATRLGVTTPTLYRLPAYRMGRVIRLKAADVAAFEATCRIQPGSLSHLIPDRPGQQRSGLPLRR